MAVNFEIKGMLAKCLAMENIIIEHKKVDTACFNVHTRCLTLPLWEKASDNVYNMLVLHEISHSLFTPNIDWTENHKIPQQFINVCEDVRVEKLDIGHKEFLDYIYKKYLDQNKNVLEEFKESREGDFFKKNG